MSGFINGAFRFDALYSSHQRYPPGFSRADVEAARGLLDRLPGSVILRRPGSQPLAEMKGQIDRLVVDALGGDNRGAGRGIQALSVVPWSLGDGLSSEQ